MNRRSSKSLLATVAAILLTAATAACHRDVAYSRYEHTSARGWERSDTVQFSDIVITATGDYREEISLRTTEGFPFTKLFLTVEQQVRPMASHRTDTLSCRLVDDEGHVTGRGLSFYHYHFPLTTLHLNAGDTLTVRIRHNMLREVLPGVSDVGVKLLKP